MVSSNIRRRYTTIAIPGVLYDNIREIVDSSGDAYRNPTEFCLSAIRDKYEKILTIRLQKEL